MTMLTFDDLATKLIELENHPGLEHLRRYGPAGVTAQRWTQVQSALGRMWDDLAEGNASTDGAGDALQRAEAAYPTVKEFLDAVDAVNTRVAHAIAPPLKRFDATGVDVPGEVTDLLAVSASDPLSLTDDEIESRIASIVELAALQEKWPEALADTADHLVVLRDAVQHAAQTRVRATRTVLTGPLPVCSDPEPGLRAELDSMAAPDPAGLRELQRRIESALDRVRHDEALAQGLLDRRAELAGRLRAYQAKATRLGLATDRELLSAHRLATDLLKRRPCDLRAVTRAVVDYQQTMTAKQGTTR